MIIFCILIYGSFEDQTEIAYKGKIAKSSFEKQTGQMQGKGYVAG